MAAHKFITKEIAVQLCPQLKQLRLDYGLSLEELAAKGHFSLRLLKRIDNNKCLPFGCLLKLAAFYGKKIRLTLE